MKNLIDNINSNLLHVIGGFAITALFLIFGTAPFWALIVCALLSAGFEVNQLHSLCPRENWKPLILHSLYDWLYSMGGGLSVIVIYYIGRWLVC